MNQFIYRIQLSIKVFIKLVNLEVFSSLEYEDLTNQFILIVPSSLLITMITSFFISLVLSLQIVKEFLYLNASDLVGPILAISFIRELSPVLTSIIVIGKIGSFITAEIATMSVTEQIDALLILGVNPINYLFLPRIIAMLLALPLLNLLSVFTSLMSSSFICVLIYSIDTTFFFCSLIYDFFYLDILKSILKTLIFGLYISVISCVWGFTTRGGSKQVGLSITSSVVTSLICLFILNFILSYLVFNNSVSSFKVL
uniref:ABC transporter permease n=1 Tax=Periphykon beckeri TaxID=2006982 RepID=A0A1Z1M383_9FLOR|nr:hypothetical protein [Periphykon beckeri]ARW60340.1 hypothetical protein [Periphykon beckeri]